MSYTCHIKNNFLAEMSDEFYLTIISLLVESRWIVYANNNDVLDLTKLIIPLSFLSISLSLNLFLTVDLFLSLPLSLIVSPSPPSKTIEWL